jgi:hypothetical protein
MPRGLLNRAETPSASTCAASAPPAKVVTTPAALIRRIRFPSVTKRPACGPTHSAWARLCRGRGEGGRDLAHSYAPQVLEARGRPSRVVSCRPAAGKQLGPPTGWGDAEHAVARRGVELPVGPEVEGADRQIDPHRRGHGPGEGGGGRLGDAESVEVGGVRHVECGLALVEGEAAAGRIEAKGCGMRAQDRSDDRRAAHHDRVAGPGLRKNLSQPGLAQVMLWVVMEQQLVMRVVKTLSFERTATPQVTRTRNTRRAAVEPGRAVRRHKFRILLCILLRFEVLFLRPRKSILLNPCFDTGLE